MKAFGALARPRPSVGAPAAPARPATAYRGPEPVIGLFPDPERPMSVAIIDYGSGNLHSAAKAFERAAREAGLDEAVAVTSDPDVVRRADRIVLPGVGAFADCRRGLHAVPGWSMPHRDGARRGAALLGICVGMQLMATRGLEYETSPGLDWIAGDVTAIKPTIPP